jgi:hypothetical protein
MQGKRINSLVLGAMLAMLCTATMSASIITSGTFSIAGTIFVTGPGGVTTPAGVCPVGVQCIFFQDTGTPALNGKVDIAPLGLPNGDIPATISGNDAGNIFSLMNPPEIVDGAGFPATPFMSFVNGGVTTVLEINFIPPGINGTAGCSASPPAAGQVCTPAGSLFNLQNLTATSSTATFRFQGVTNDSSSTWTGIFASSFNTLPYQSVLAAFAANGFGSDTFQGQITLTAGPPVPEPGTTSLLMLGSGMIGFATLLRRLSNRPPRR